LWLKKEREIIERACEIFMPLGFRQIVVTTAEEHDTIITLTSQLAHVVSNAYVKSPRAQSYRGFSAGSYADLTRVARLEEKMWTELFLENSDYLVEEIDFLVQSLTTCRDVIARHDSDALEALLRYGRECKERQE
jgi:prephenate dehydrogenase